MNLDVRGGKINVTSRIRFNGAVDAIAETDSHVVVGTYKHSNCMRKGSVEFLEKESLGAEVSYLTNGTLSLSVKDNRVFCACEKELLICNHQKMMKRVKTPSMNTYVHCGSYVFVTEIFGNLKIFTYELELIETVKISNDALWVVKEHNGLLYIGGEDGYAYVCDFESRLKNKKTGSEESQCANVLSDHMISSEDCTTDNASCNSSLNNSGTDACIRKINKKRRDGIIDFLFADNKVYVSSYDDNVIEYDEGTLEELGTHEKIGSCWKMIEDGDLIYAACMYEGLKVFSRDFKELACVKTNSICYGLCVEKNRLLYSSFYDDDVYVADPYNKD